MPIFNLTRASLNFAVQDKLFQARDLLIQAIGFQGDSSRLLLVAGIALDAL
jgi:hypothetical protein